MAANSSSSSSLITLEKARSKFDVHRVGRMPYACMYNSRNFAINSGVKSQVLESES